MKPTGAIHDAAARGSERAARDQTMIGMNRRGFLRALVVAPFAAPAIALADQGQASPAIPAILSKHRLAPPYVEFDGGDQRVLLNFKINQNFETLYLITGEFCGTSGAEKA